MSAPSLSLPAEYGEKVIQLAAEMLVHDLREEAENRVNREVDNLVEKHLKAAFNEELGKRVSAEIESIFAQGWYRTDEYGRVQNKAERLSIHDFVLNYLKKPDSYGNGPSYATKTITETVNKAIEKEMTDYVRPKVREAIDPIIAAKIGQTLKEALGLK